MRDILETTTAPRGHWVGDGFPVRSLFSHMSGRSETTPFLMLDYGGPHEFAPAAQPRGVGVHPHKGFETVTIVYQGEVEHGDSTGRGGVIREGDVQWMTAGDGILHKEFHSQDFTRNGGTFEMVQLWVNLPAASKAAAPGMTRALARELGPSRIRVNTLVPGWVMTEKQLAMWVDDAAKELISRSQCLPGSVLPEHIANMALFLASDASAMCSAQNFIVDGGWV